MGLVLNNLQRLIYHKTNKQTDKQTNKQKRSHCVDRITDFSRLKLYMLKNVFFFFVLEHEDENKCVFTWKKKQKTKKYCDTIQSNKKGFININ